MCDPTSTPTPFELERALSRGVLYEALALGLRRPGAELVERLGSVEGMARLAAAAFCVDPRTGSELAAATAVLGESGRVEPAELDLEYGRIFGHTAQGPAPPYETEYGDTAAFLQPQELADLAGFYCAFGLRLNPAAAERLDHISCECEFMLFLARKEAFAIAQLDLTMREQTRRAQFLFLRDHLNRFAPALAHRIRRCEPHPIYAGLAQLLAAWVRVECAAWQIAGGSVLLRLRETTADCTPVACGTSCELVPLAEES